MPNPSQDRSRKLLIKGAIVLTMDQAAGDFDVADVLVENNLIAAVGPNLGAVEGAEIIEAHDAIVMPGFVDSHRHLWHTVLRNVLADTTSGQFMRIAGQAGSRFTPDDVYVSSRLGAAECLNAGITTVLDWCHIANTPEHADAAVQSAFDSGARVVFAHSVPLTFPADQPHTDIDRVRDRWFSSPNPLVSLAMAARGPEITQPEVNDADFALARELGIGISFHAGAWGGADGAALQALYERGQMGADINYVHLNFTRNDVLDLIAKTGGTASITPLSEMLMGATHPPTERLLARGIKTGIATDTALWGGSALFTEIKQALSAVRAQEARRCVDEKRYYTEVGLRVGDALQLVTQQAAAAIWLDHQVGSLTPGKRADLLLVKRTGLNMLPITSAAHARAAIATTAEPADIDAVMVEGRWAKWGGQLIGVDVASLRTRAEQIRARIV
jgi:5-methylthioadenosine/S-adenosylhomocysteine deaminase